MPIKHPETTVIDLRQVRRAAQAEKRKPGRPRNTWITGTDPVTHAQYVAWAKARAQAHFRKQVWDLSWPDWQTVWQGQWHLRGRGSDNLCMIRIESELPWDLNNVRLILRSEHCRVNANYMAKV